jgi:hypothetical protein
MSTGWPNGCPRTIDGNAIGIEMQSNKANAADVKKPRG